MKKRKGKQSKRDEVRKHKQEGHVGEKIRRER